MRLPAPKPPASSPEPGLTTGPITNHVNIVRNAKGQFAYVTIGGLNEIKVYTTTARPELVATIPTGALPHGLWPSGDGSRIYVGLENADDVLTRSRTRSSLRSPPGKLRKEWCTPHAVSTGSGTENLEPLGAAGLADHLALGAPGASLASTTVTINNQGLVDILEAAVTNLEPKHAYTLALANQADGKGPLQALSSFKTNAAGAMIVSAVAQLRVALAPQNVTPGRRYLVILEGMPGSGGGVVQIQR